MTENNQRDKPNTRLGNHCWLLGTDCWQLGTQKEILQKLFPNNPKLDKLVQIAQILDKYQKEIDYYQTRIRGILEVMRENAKKSK